MPERIDYYGIKGSHTTEAWPLFIDSSIEPEKTP